LQATSINSSQMAAARAETFQTFSRLSRARTNAASVGPNMKRLSASPCVIIAIGR
jgi:hypothetical protein